MGKTYKHQDEYDWMHDKHLPRKRLIKLLKYFSRCNFWEWDIKIDYRRHKDFKRGGVARIKKRNYKNH